MSGDYFLELDPAQIEREPWSWPDHLDPPRIRLGRRPVLLDYHPIGPGDRFWRSWNLPGPLPTCQYLCTTQGQGDQGRHRDLVTRTALNFYWDTDGAETRFYNRWRWCSAKFQARPGSLYLLNVAELHTVVKPTAQCRRFIQWSWDQSYEEIAPYFRHLVLPG